MILMSSTTGTWASEVGWYGGINYGFGYQVVGFWRMAERPLRI
jgi:hypothetical protein